MINCNRRGRVVRAWDTLIMFEAAAFDPRPGQYSRMSFSSDQVTGTVFPHLNMPFLPNSKFITAISAIINMYSVKLTLIL